jgi:hypothetical protein
MHLQIYRRAGGVPLSPWTHTELLLRLQKWFSSNCDGTWEHQRGVLIRSTDNPGWWVKIDVSGSDLEGCHFEEVRVGNADAADPQPPWMRCYLESGVWNGAGDFTRLAEIVDRFLKWAGYEE